MENIIQIRKLKTFVKVEDVFLIEKNLIKTFHIIIYVIMTLEMNLILGKYIKGNVLMVPNYQAVLN